MKYLKLFEEHSKDITQIIMNLSKEFIDDIDYEDYNCEYDLNNGLCAEFSEEVINRMGGYSDNLFELSSDQFLNNIEPDFAKENWLGELIETEDGSIWSKQMLDKFGYPPNGIDLTKVEDISHHVWIYYNGKHYDAETPNGVSNWTELPIFRRVFNMLKTGKWVKDVNLIK